MRVCLIGDIQGNIDEGMKKVAFHLYNELSKDNDVRVYHPYDIFSFNFWKSLSQFEPEIIHYIPGPSIKSFIITKILGLHYKGAKTVMSATFPYFSSFSKLFIPFLRPDLILVQSDEYGKIFKGLECKTEFLPNGVDIDKFHPVDAKSKIQLREKYGIDKNKFVILHVGHIKERRGIRALSRLQSHENQAVIIGSTSTGVEEELKKSIENLGIMVITEYINNIEEYYQLSDCYVFPVVSQHNSIQIPLSVLEAMACNLPIISTKFGALSKVFREGEGLFFVNNDDRIINLLEEIKTGNMEIETREKVLHYSWTNVAKRLECIYNRRHKEEL